MSSTSVELQAFAQSPESGALALRARVERRPNEIQLCFFLQGDLARLYIPDLVPSRRRDELWRHTCAEIFVAAKDQPSYCEFNFSPSTEWAMYEFDGYRQGMRTLDGDAPAINVQHNAGELRMTVQCPLPAFLANAASLQIGVTMVIESSDGHCSYWSLKHPTDRPDFHHRNGFVLEL